MAKEFMYPTHLAGANVPFMRITANKYQYGGGGDSIASVSLYHPPGVSFSDGAGYSTMDMGPMGNQLIKGLGEGQGALDIARDANATVNSPGNSDLRTMMSLKIAKSATASLLIPGTENLQDIYGASKGIAVNPNTVSSFSNMTIRSYTFNFKMIAEDPSESEEILNIHTFFREEMYPEQGSGSYILTYPSTFNIKFYSQDGKENQYYPHIYECYLTNLQTNLNTSGNMHFDGGAPIEVDISLTFQETKVLTKGDLGAYWPKPANGPTRGEG